MREHDEVRDLACLMLEEPRLRRLAVLRIAEHNLAKDRTAS